MHASYKKEEQSGRVVTSSTPWNIPIPLTNGFLEDYIMKLILKELLVLAIHSPLANMVSQRQIQPQNSLVKY